jgi:hypothetical protein
MSDIQIYVITVVRPTEIAGPVKVGISNNVSARLRGLQTACPYPLQLVHAFLAPDRTIAKSVESAFHHVLREHRTSGEWFDLHPCLATLYMCLNFEAMLRHHLSFDGIEFDAIIEMAGITAAKEKLREWNTRIEPQVLN